MRSVLVVCLCVLAATASSADGGDQPIEALQKGVEEAIRILKNPEFNNTDRKDVQQQKLRAIMARLFDFDEFSRRYKDETLIYVGQQLTSGTRALVKVRVVWKGEKIPVDLLMVKREGLWKVYDIQLLGFSAVRNYRAQFQFMLLTETPAQVIERLKMKTEQLEKRD
jgi:phospholipid transport system substrate-binding protein